MNAPVPLRVAALTLAAAALVAGLAGGLARLGMPGPAPEVGAWHGALMASGFLGTVIGLERAIALGMRRALAAPFASGLGTVAILAGFVDAGLALWVIAPLALLAASVAIARRQPAAHTVLLAIAAGAWAVGNAAFAFGASRVAPTWWFAFLVLTIAAERLELTRLMRRSDAGPPLFSAAVIALLAAAVLTGWNEAAGREVFGITLVAFAAWLATFDVARRTVRMHGLARYAAVALLAGYSWLAVGGFAWAFAPGARDLGLHALGLGFVFSMIFAHAPIVIPVVARLPVRYTPLFYLPLALLHAGLALRVTLGASDATLRLAGGVLDAAAVGLFAALLVASLGARDRRHAPAYGEVAH